MTLDICVIGGGASGLAAAVRAARLSGGRLSIAVVERLSRVGKKLLATGNGHCNLSNTRAPQTGYHGDVKFAQQVMERISPDDALDFFEEIGVHPRREESGRVYPMSEQASSVLDSLRLSLSEAGVEEICDFEVVALKRASGLFHLTAKDGRKLTARKVILASGGLTAPSLGGSSTGYALAEGLGHSLTARFPALVQIKTDPGLVRALKGIRFTGTAAILKGDVCLREESGEVLFTDYGLSGPVIMQLSRFAQSNKKDPLCVSLRFLPESSEEVLSLLYRRQSSFPDRSLENFLTGMVSKRIGQTLLKQAFPDLPLSSACSVLNHRQLRLLADILTDWRLPCTGTMGFEQAQVTAGGVRTRDVSCETMESRLVSGLYLTGELLDVDGDCGGFNLQWAWSSGLLAAESAVCALEEGI